MTDVNKSVMEYNYKIESTICETLCLSIAILGNYVFDISAHAFSSKLKTFVLIYNANLSFVCQKKLLKFLDINNKRNNVVDVKSNQKLKYSKKVSKCQNFKLKTEK